MSIQSLSLKELVVLAQQRLAGRAGELKTRQELIDALEADEARRARRAPKAAAPPAPPAPAAIAPVVKELPPEPVIWTGHAPLPKITAVEAPPVLSDFFAAPPKPAEPYEDDRVLTFARDPQTVYAAWDFSKARFELGSAQGHVVNQAGATLQSFAVGNAQGGAFVGQLPGSVALKVEVRRGEKVLGASGWLTLEARGNGSGVGSSGVTAGSSAV